MAHIGEDYAAQIIGRWGWELLRRNYRSRFGEIDLIFAEPRTTKVPAGLELYTAGCGVHLHFIEVKFWPSADGQNFHPLRSLNSRRRRRYVRSAWMFVHEEKLFQQAVMHFDLAYVRAPDKLEYFPDLF